MQAPLMIPRSKEEKQETPAETNSEKQGHHDTIHMVQEPKICMGKTIINLHGGEENTAGWEAGERRNDEMERRAANNEEGPIEEEITFVDPKRKRIGLEGNQTNGMNNEYKEMGLGREGGENKAGLGGVLDITMKEVSKNDVAAGSSPRACREQ